MAISSDNTVSGDQPQSRGGWGGCIAVVFGGVFFAAGVFMLWTLTMRPILGIVAARGWEPTDCVVVSSELKADADGETSRLEVVYKYQFNGKDYQSDRYCFVTMPSNTSMGWKRGIVRDHPPGKVTKCYVNPEAPAEAVIHRGWAPDLLWGIFPVPFIVAGLAMMFFGPSLVRAGNRMPGQANWRPNIPESGAMPLADFPSYGQAAGLVTLKPQSTPLVGCLVVLGIAIFWNGIVSVFLFHAIDSFRNGPRAGDWFLALFLTPFVLIGLGLIAGVFYAFLTIFNPQPTLTVNSTSLPLGETLFVRWTFSGRTSSISQLKIVLRGVEKAKYTRGTSTYTDEEKFAEFLIFETFDTLQMLQGEARFTIPADTMHSFDAPNNKIEWSLNLRGEISFWPDVAASFPIVLLPLATGVQP